MTTTEATKPAVRGIAASYYMTKDLAAAIAFYDDLFGFAPATTMPGAMCEYVFPDGNAFGLYQMPSFSARGGVMFVVDDAAAFVASAKARGVTFDGDGHIEESPVCRMAFGIDPDGNRFVVHEAK